MNIDMSDILAKRILPEQNIHCCYLKTQGWHERQNKNPPILMFHSTMSLPGLAAWKKCSSDKHAQVFFTMSPNHLRITVECQKRANR
jgi:hypothetical protein